MSLRNIVLALGMSWLLACSPSPTRVSPEFIDSAVELERKALEDVLQREPEAREALDRAVGYAVFSNQATKAPVIGHGKGVGVAVDVANGQRHYLSVTHFDVGGGLGHLGYRLVILFFDRKDFERMRSGTLHLGASVEASAGGEAAGVGATGGSASGKKKRAVYLLGDSGAAATWTVRLVRFVPLAEG